MKKICIVTGTRAEYGLLKPVIDRVYHANTMELHLVVTGMHLSPEFGLTYREIEEDGYPIDTKIEMLLSSDTSAGVTKSMGVALLGFADYFDENRSDIVVLLGDRYEALMAATAAMMARIPIAHIHGGETTEGAVDEAIRHSITKMSHLHFTATEAYRNRVIQLGEQPQNVYCVGALGVENVKAVSLLDRKTLEESIGLTFRTPTIMVTYHPVTLENQTAGEQFGNLLKVIGRHKELQVIFTKANADPNGRIVNQMIDDYVEKNHTRCRAYTSLGQLRYLSALQFCNLVMGNSSSGIIEVPSFGIPTIDIGDRQRGRVSAESVIHCENGERDIERALVQAMSQEFRDSIRSMKNPYEGSHTSKQIVEVVEESLERGINLKKKFYDSGNALHA